LKSPAHITLVPPFWLEEDLEVDLLSDISNFARTKSAFEIILHDFDSFKPRVIFLSVNENDQLSAIHRSLNDYLYSLSKYPIKKESRPFHPHVTIANRDLRKKDFGPAFEHFKSINYSASFKTDSISLLKHNGTAWEVAGSAGLIC